MSYISEEQGLEKDSSIKTDKKPDKFRLVRERVAFLTGKHEKTQGEFDNYHKSLFDTELCKYLTGLKDIVSLCNNTLFECKFRSRDNFNFRGKLKFECQREKMIRLRNMV